jgi:hypothetical protein
MSENNSNDNAKTAKIPSWKSGQFWKVIGIGVAKAALSVAGGVVGAYAFTTMKGRVA